jgi:hypothetical protein
MVSTGRQVPNKLCFCRKSQHLRSRGEIDMRALIGYFVHHSLDAGGCDVKVSWFGILGSLLLLVPAADAAKVTLKSGRVMDGIVISRPEAVTGRAVITVHRLEGNRVFQFDLNKEVAMIESGTEAKWILKETATVRDGTSEKAPVIRRFTPGMEFRLESLDGKWAYVVPEAEGLVKDQGWMPASALTRKLDLEALPPEEKAVEGLIKAPKTPDKQAVPPEGSVPKVEPPPEGSASEPAPEVPEATN